MGGAVSWGCAAAVDERDAQDHGMVAGSRPRLDHLIFKKSALDHLIVITRIYVIICKICKISKSIDA